MSRLSSASSAWSTSTFPLPSARPSIGWRLARGFWGRGYATEAARAALADGFGRLGLSEIVASAVLGNTASFNVMQRIGMTRDRDGDFDLPGPEGSPIRRAALYRVRRGEELPWTSSATLVDCAGRTSRR